MLIRIVDHFKDNPKRIDKLIAVKGLPDKWLFTDIAEGRTLRHPWEPDIDKNIPNEIRHLCEPTYIVRKHPAITAGAASVLEKYQILGVKIDYNTEPGRQMWEDVERYIEETIPRDVRIPVAVLCARDERSAFDTYRPRRNSRGSLELEPSPVPLVDLTLYQKQEATPKVFVEDHPVPSTPVTETRQDSEFKCEECDYHHRSQQGIRMHKMKRHPKKEKVGAS